MSSRVYYGNHSYGCSLMLKRLPAQWARALVLALQLWLAAYHLSSRLAWQFYLLPLMAEELHRVQPKGFPRPSSLQQSRVQPKGFLRECYHFALILCYQRRLYHNTHICPRWFLWMSGNTDRTVHICPSELQLSILLGALQSRGCHQSSWLCPMGGGAAFGVVPTACGAPSIWLTEAGAG
jgi:hypothetical protein